MVIFLLEYIPEYTYEFFKNNVLTQNCTLTVLNRQVCVLINATKKTKHLLVCYLNMLSILMFYFNSFTFYSNVANSFFCKVLVLSGLLKSIFALTRLQGVKPYKNPLL